MYLLSTGKITFCLFGALNILKSALSPRHRPGAHALDSLTHSVFLTKGHDSLSQPALEFRTPSSVKGPHFRM